jgi:cytoskeletal protein CcmA (bactofilin family)
MNEGTTTVLGTAAVVAGELASDDDVTIHGTVEGPVSSGSTLRVGPNGDIRGDVTAADIHLEGSITGEVRASGILEIGPTGRVIGDIHAAGLRIHDGGTFHGHVEMLDDAIDAVRIPGSGPEPPGDLSAETMISPPPEDFDPAALTVMRSPPELPGVDRFSADPDDGPPPEWPSQELVQAERKAAVRSAVERDERAGGPQPERSLSEMLTETGRFPPLDEPDEEPPQRPLDQIDIDTDQRQ